MKLWQKGKATEKLVEQFTVGMDRELDVVLAPFDVLGSLAHTRMLHSIDLLTADELAQVQTELKGIYHEISAGTFEIEDGIEDVHSQIELLLTRRIGDVGKKIHSGRSRNDQVLVDLKLYFRDEIMQMTQLVQLLFDQL